MILKKSFLNIKGKILSFLNTFFKGKSAFNIILDITTFVLFGLAFFSIPACSFSKSLNIITWILTIGFLSSMALSCFLYYNFKLDIVSVSLIIFCFSTLISTALNGWAAFKITPIVLPLCTCLIYIYCKGSKYQSTLLKMAFFGTIIFLGLFIGKYWSDLIQFNFARLGKAFGDENDIAIILSLGMCLAGYYAVFSKNLFFTLINLLLFVLFSFCGVSTGSKIFLLLFIFSFIFLTIIKCGKKKWWLAICIIVGCFLLATLLLMFAPFLSSLKARVISMINEIFGLNIPGGSSTDTSTSNRWGMFANGITMFFRKPMMGWGIWGFATFSGYDNGWSHNNFSETLCNFGLIGSVLFHMGFFYSFKGYKKSMFKEKQIAMMIVIFYIICMLSVALNSQKVYAYSIPLAFSSLCSCTDIVFLKTSSLIKRKIIKESENC